jgi:hypothetical protein
MGLRSQRDFFHRVCAANRAISARFSGVSFIALARPPLGPPALPRATAVAVLPCSSGVGSRSSTWPLAISTTSLAAWLKSRGRLGCFSTMIGDAINRNGGGGPSIQSIEPERWIWLTGLAPLVLQDGPLSIISSIANKARAESSCLIQTDPLPDFCVT